MITIKTLKTFEQNTWREILQFSRRHPYIFYISLIMISVLIFTNHWAHFEAGDNGCYVYESGNGYCTWWFAPIDILVSLFLRILPLYIIYRIYLQYKHDNL